MDFTYIYAEDHPDFPDFMQGRHFSEDAVYAEIGRPEDWSYRTGVTKSSRSDEEAGLVAQQIATYKRWALNPRYPEAELE
jgi:hypothetical protein